MEKKNSQLAITTEKLAEYLDLFGFKNIPDNEKKQFIEICQMANLNPFAREAHISAYGEGKYRQFAVITGYEVYIRRAEESGRLLGWNSPVISQCKTATPDLKGNIKFVDDIEATITIHRKGFDIPFVHSVKFSEYVQKTKEGNVNKFWQKPETMLKKVAIAQGFRLCFPDVLKNLPYAREEFNNKTIDITNQQTEEETGTPKLNGPAKIPGAKVSKQEPKEKEPAKVLPELILDSPEWQKALEYISEQPDTEKALAKIRLKYSLNNESEKDLIVQATDLQLSKEAENGK